MTLLEANPIPLGRDVEVADVSIHAIERQLELRESTRPVPRIDLDLRIVGPEALETQQQSLAIPVMSQHCPGRRVAMDCGAERFCGLADLTRQSCGFWIIDDWFRRAARRGFCGGGG